MKIALCNEMFEGRSMADVCEVSRRLGYDGIEIAPFTLAPSADEITPGARKEVRQTIEDHGLETVGRMEVVRGKKDVWSHPVICDGRLYVRYHETLHCYDVRR